MQLLGSVGGDAFEANTPCTLINNGIIRSGGGTGGSGGQGSYTSTVAPGWSGLYDWSSYGSTSTSQTGYRQVARWGYSYVVNSYTTSTTVGSYSRGGLVTITYSGNTPIDASVSIKPPQIILMAAMAGLVRATIRLQGAGTAGGTNAGQGGTGGSYGQAGAIGFAGNYGNGTAGNAAGKAVKGIGIGYITFTDNGTTLGSTV